MNNITEVLANEILGTENYILTDSGPLVSTNGSTTDHLFESQTFGSLDDNILTTALNDINLTEKWFSKENVYTVPKVSEELKRYSTLIKNKYDYLRARQNSIKTIGYKYSKSNHYKKKFIKRNPIHLDVAQFNEQLLSELAFSGIKLINKVKKKVLTVNEKADYFVNFVESLEESLKIKRDTNKKYEDRVSENYDLKTDEELVGRALYESQFMNKSVSVVSSDFDILWLVIGASLVLPGFNEHNLHAYIINNDSITRLSDPLEYEISQTRFIEAHGVSAVKKASDDLANLSKLATSFVEQTYQEIIFDYLQNQNQGRP
ncbi:hypothetical protein COV13_04450 [Candidatus Woesearchaeota archaeon CG10_big_fil_rev_8_21_14_0_10_32_9]|nr:MAG: hypothetical protein COV13_04450 [Candidatus Woesearchaeota archaeon CG10_big_fil_rev_8_21_14_0_10_32_9]